MLLFYFVFSILCVLIIATFGAEHRAIGATVAVWANDSALGTQTASIAHAAGAILANAATVAQIDAFTAKTAYQAVAFNAIGAFAA